MWILTALPARVTTLFSWVTVLLWQCLHLSICINFYERDTSFLYLRFTWVPLFSPALSKQLSYCPFCCPLFSSYQYNWRQFLWYRQKSFKNWSTPAVYGESVGGFEQTRKFWMNVKNLLSYEQRSAKVYIAKVYIVVKIRILWDFTTDIQNCNTYQSLKQIGSPVKFEKKLF